MRIVLAPRTRTGAALAVVPVPVPPSDDDPFAGVAADAELVRSSPLSLDEGLLAALLTAPSLSEALLALEEGIYWDEARHPRWPKGTPLAGQFMQVGQRFAHKGVLYDVAGRFPGYIHAHVATKGHGASAKTVRIEAKKVAGEEGFVVPGIARPAAEAILAHKGGTNTTATVVDPYVYPETHDPNIPIPPTAPADLTPEKWKRFGKLDQERYSQLMERYGTWQPGLAQTKVNATIAGAEAVAKQIVTSGYSHQYGSSSGTNLNFLNLFKGGKEKSQGELEGLRGKYEAALALQDEAAGIIQWDLYNRVEAPDISLFHKDDAHTVGWWNQNIVHGDEPVFGGLSQSQYWRPGFFGNVTLATPTAIRHVVLSTISADLVHHGYGSEQEVSVSNLWAPQPGKSLVFDSSQLNPSQKSWLEGETLKAAGGDVIERLKAAMEKGEIMPAPKVGASIHMLGAGGQQWKDPPPLAKEQDSKGKKVVSMGYTGPGGKALAQPWSELNVKPGDYVQGNPSSDTLGTKYLIIPDPSSSAGFAYYKVTDVDGTTLWTGTPTAYQPQSMSDKFKKLDGHFDLEAWYAKQEKKPSTGFVKGAWAETKEVKQIWQLDAGTKFVVHGVPYELTAKPNLGSETAQIKSLADGNTGTIAAGYETPWLTLKPGYTEEGVPAFDPAFYFEGPKAVPSKLDLSAGDIVKSGGAVWQVKAISPGKPIQAVQLNPKPGLEGTVAGNVSAQVMIPKPPGWQEPAPGMTLPYQGKKATVTKVFKSGEVQINLAPGVVKLKPSDPALSNLFDLDAHELGPKTKLKQFAPGQAFHGGTGLKQIRPYRVIEQKGKTTLVQNLDTGEELELGSQKSYAALLPKGTGALPPGPTEIAPVDHSAVFDLSAWDHAGVSKGVTELVEGDVFVGSGGVPFKVAGHVSVPGTKLKGLSVQNLLTSETHTLPAVGSFQYELLKPKSAAPPSVPGELLATGEWMPAHGITLNVLPVGALFASEDPTNPQSATQFATEWEVLGHDNGKTQIKVVKTTHAPVLGNETTANLSYVPAFVKLPAAPEAELAPLGPDQPFDPMAWKPAGKKKLSELKAGDIYSVVSGPGYYKVETVKAAAGLPIIHVQSIDNPAYSFTLGGPSSYDPDEKVEVYAPKVGGGAGPPTAFDPDAYTVGPPTALSDLQVGDIFQGPKKGKHYVVTKTGAKSGLSAMDLHTGKVSAPWKYDKVAPKLIPKATQEIAHDALKEGDPVQIAKLQPGDQFEVLGGKTYELVQQGGPESGPVAAAVLDDGVSLGGQSVMPSYSGLTLVTWHEKSAAPTGMEAGKLKVGDYFKAVGKQAINAGPGTPYVMPADDQVFKVAEFPASGDVWAEMIGGPSPGQVYVFGQAAKVELASPPSEEFASPPNDFVSTGWKPAGEAKAGDVLSNLGGIDWTTSFWKVVGTKNEQGNIFVVPFGSSAEDAPWTAVPGDMEVKHYANKASVPPGSELPPLDAGTFDDWQPVGPLVDVKDVPLGEWVQTPTGQKYAVVDGPSGSGIDWVELSSLDAGPDEMPEEAPKGLKVQLLAKPVEPTTHAPLEFGDMVEPGELKIGDFFQTDYGNLYEVTDVVPSTQAGTAGVHLTTKHVGSPHGSPMQGTQTLWWPSHKKAGGQQWTLVPAPAGASEPEPESESWPGLMPYSSKSGHKGAYAPVMLGQIAAGTQFTDKSGKVYVVDHHEGGLTYFRSLDTPIGGGNPVYGSASHVKVKPL